MLPSRRLIFLILLAAPIFLGGAVLPRLANLALLYLACLGAYAAFDLLLLPRRKSIELRRIVPPRLSLAVPARVVLEIRNAGSVKVLVQLAEQLPPPLTADPVACSAWLAPGQSASLEYRLCGPRRRCGECCARRWCPRALRRPVWRCTSRWLRHRRR